MPKVDPEDPALDQLPAPGLPVSLPPALPSVLSLNSRIVQAIAALDKDAKGAVFLYADVDDSGEAVGKLAVVQKLGDHWAIDLEAHVAKKSGEPWNGGKWDKGASLLVRGVW